MMIVNISTSPYIEIRVRTSKRATAKANIAFADKVKVRSLVVIMKEGSGTYSEKRCLSFVEITYCTREHVTDKLKCMSEHPK